MDFLNQRLGSLIVCCLGLLSLTNGQQLTLAPPEPSVKKFVNETYFVSCVTSDGSTNAEWYNPRGQKVDSNPQQRIYMDHAAGVDLFIKRITTQDEGKYTCKPTRGGQRVQFDLKVIRPITFDMSEAEQWAEEGKNRLLRCTPRGHDSPRVYWRIDNKQIPSGSTKYKQMKDGLLIHNVTQQDGLRSYVCRAIDINSPLPDSKTLNISLKVKMKPKILASNTKLEHFGVIGDWANLTCRVQAEPKAKFEWLFQNKILIPSDTVVIHNQDNESILQVLVRTEYSFGTYDCRATNEMGEDRRRMTLRKGRKPGIPKLEAMRVTKDSATIKINITPERSGGDDKKLGAQLPITGLIVQYKMVTKSEWLPASFVPNNNYREFTVTKLTPEVTYNIRAALRNQAAQGEFSSSQFAIKTDLTSATTNVNANSWYILAATAMHLLLIAFL